MKLCADTKRRGVSFSFSDTASCLCICIHSALFTWTLLLSCCNQFSSIHSKMLKTAEDNFILHFFPPMTHISLNTHMDWTRCKISAALCWICILICLCKWAAQGDVGQSCICNGKYSDLMRREENLYRYTQRLLSLVTSALHQANTGF